MNRCDQLYRYWQRIRSMTSGCTAVEFYDFIPRLFSLHTWPDVTKDEFLNYCSRMDRANVLK